MARNCVDVFNSTTKNVLHELDYKFKFMGFDRRHKIKSQERFSRGNKTLLPLSLSKPIKDE